MRGVEWCLNNLREFPPRQQADSLSLQKVLEEVFNSLEKVPGK